MAKQDARAEDAVADAYMDVGGRAKQDARAEQSAIRHKQHKHLKKLKGRSNRQDGYHSFSTINSRLQTAFNTWFTYSQLRHHFHQ
jgi:hypothetical protein